MGKHFWVSSDESLSASDRFWLDTSIVFHIIFDRIEAAFGPHEFSCREICYLETGIDGVDLSEVDKNCFNVFCFRCKLAFSQFPDAEYIEYEKLKSSLKDSHKYIILEWSKIISLLEKDKRYDPEWIARAFAATAPSKCADKGIGGPGG